MTMLSPHFSCRHCILLKIVSFEVEGVAESQGLHPLTDELGGGYSIITPDKVLPGWRCPCGETSPSSSCRPGHSIVTPDIVLLYRIEYYYTWTSADTSAEETMEEE